MGEEACANNKTEMTFNPIGINKNYNYLHQSIDVDCTPAGYFNGRI